MILRQSESFLGSCCFPLALDSKGRQQDPGKALAKIPWERLSPACGEHGTRWGRESCEEHRSRSCCLGSRHWETRLTREATNGNLTEPSPALPVQVRERSEGQNAQLPLRNPRHHPGGVPWEPPGIPVQHCTNTLPKFLPDPLGSASQPLPASRPAPGHISQNRQGPTHLIPNFYQRSPPRSSCWERLSCPREQPRVGDARSAPQRLEEPSGGHGGDTGGAKISPKLPSKG